MSRAKEAFAEGVVELWLTSEDTGAYGRDIGRCENNNDNMYNFDVEFLLARSSSESSRLDIPAKSYYSYESYDSVNNGVNVQLTRLTMSRLAREFFCSIMYIN